MRHLVNGVLCVCVALWASSAMAVTGAQVVDKVRKNFEKLDALSAEFEKRFEWKLAEEVHESKGRLYFQKPNKYRVEADGTVVCSDGVSVWTYSKANGQVLISEASPSSEQTTPQSLLFRYTEDYEAQYEREEKVGKSACYVVRLKPREEGAAFVAEMTAWVDTKSGLTRKVTYRDTSGNVTTYQLSRVQTGEELDEALFRFDAPEGVEVIDMRQ